MTSNHCSPKIIIFSVVCALFSLAGQAQCSFSLGADTLICQGQSINLQLSAPPAYTSYLWSNGSTAQSITATSAGNYSCTATLLGNDLVVNGNFSTGNTGFTSNYIPGTGGMWGQLSNPGTYAVTTNPNLAHNNFFSFGDHTTGTGSMLVCNGSSQANDVVWNQSITVTPNTNYKFSAWVTSVENIAPGSEAMLQFAINGALVGPVFNAPLNAPQWANFAVNWNSGTNTTAIITIVDQNTLGSANDFALDDIFFQQACVASDTLTVTVAPLPIANAGSTQTITCTDTLITLNGSASSANMLYSWMAPGNVPAGNAPNGISTIVAGSGTYTLTVSNPQTGCSASSTVLVNTNNTHPLLNAGVDVQIPCPGTTVNLNPTSAVQSNCTYLWTGPGGYSSAQLVPTAPVSMAGTYYLNAINTVNGCISIDTVQVSMGAAPVAAFTASVLSGQAPLSVQFINTGTNTPFNHWVFGDGNMADNINNTTNTYQNPGNYQVMLVLTNGSNSCSDTAYVDIWVYNEPIVIIPNIFSPNGDKVNDVFEVQTLAVKELTIDIFNRWGNKITSFNGLNDKWDGKDQHEGTYFFLAKGMGINGSSIQKQGNILLVK